MKRWLALEKMTGDRQHVGEWAVLQGPRGQSASIICPLCGRLAALLDHSIDRMGYVTPSVRCPYDDCSWHENVQLIGWGDAIQE